MKTVLALHGFMQNASVFNKRLGALRKECGKEIELVFVDAPIILQPADLRAWSSQNTALLANFAESEPPEASAGAEDPALIPRAWWKVNKERTTYAGIEESIVMIRDVLRKRRFDGILGFSQGAAFAAAVAALLERPHLYPPFLIDGESPHPPLQFCISISGYKPGGDICERIFTPSYSTPTLHVLGKTDVVVVEERSRHLIAVSSNQRIEEHPGGHFVPSKGSWRKFLVEYMKNPGVDISSPGSTLSGTATPLEISSESASRTSLQIEPTRYTQRATS